MKKFLNGLLIIPVILLACNHAKNDDTTNRDTVVKSDIQVENKTAPKADLVTTGFLIQAADGSMADMQSGKLAAEKATNKRVKDFGAKMTGDHSSVTAEVKSLASAKKVNLSDSLFAETKKEIELTAQKSGNDFDKAYMDMIIKEQQENLLLFSTTYAQTNDEDLKDFISRTYPTLKSQLDLAQEIRKEL